MGGTAQATLKAIQPKLTQNTTATTITFGTLTFDITCEDAPGLLIPDSPPTVQPGAQRLSSENIHFKYGLSNTSTHTLSPPQLQPLRSSPPQTRHNAANTSEEDEASRPRKFSNATHKHTAAKFLKASVATGEWQKVTKKNKQKYAKNRQCFYCHKQGHTQRFCWKRLKCHNCGRNGHIAARCLFKSLTAAPCSLPHKSAKTHTDIPNAP